MIELFLLSVLSLALVLCVQAWTAAREARRLHADRSGAVSVAPASKRRV